MQSRIEIYSDPPDNDNTETSDLCLNHIRCENTDDESDTENTLIYNMLKLKTPTESNYYQQEIISSNLLEPDNNQDKKNYTPH